MPNKTRVLFVVGSLAGGGTERQVIEILRHLDRERFTPLLYLIYREGDLLEQVPGDVPIIAYWDGHEYPRWNFPGRILRNQARDLAGVIRDHQVDIVYDRTSQMTLTAALAARKVRVARVSVAAGDPQREFQTSHGRFSTSKRYLLRRAYRTASRVVAVSQGVRAGLIEFFRLPPDKVTVCYNVFDLERLDELSQAPSPELDEHRFRIVSAGRLQAEKGHVYLLRAVDELVKRRDVCQLSLWVLGRGPLETELRAFVRDNRLEHFVRFEGFQANPLPYIKRAHLFCLPSLYEGMPNALVEAMICRTPVLATDCPSGPREILDDGKYGRLVRPADPIALADAIEDAMNNYELWRATAPAARQHVAQTFSVETGMARLESLFEELHSRGGSVEW